jgi:ppGpp synthetase/RelA/SpoT-type nucleotidyltranferase
VPPTPLAPQVLFPRAYGATAGWLHGLRPWQDQLLASCQAQLRAAVAGDAQLAALCGAADVSVRSKSLFSVMRKLLRLDDMAKGGRRRTDLFDLLGMRVIVQPRQQGAGAGAAGDDAAAAAAEADAVAACYRVQQLAQQLWQPVGERCKDYIVHPKENGYQSLHAVLLLVQPQQPQQPAQPTAASHQQHAPEQTHQQHSHQQLQQHQHHSQQPNQQQQPWEEAPQPGCFLELQIRTAAMHAAATRGSASHGAYKGGLEARQAAALGAWTQELQRRLAAAPGSHQQLPAPAEATAPAAVAAGRSSGGGQHHGAGGQASRAEGASPQGAGSGGAGPLVSEAAEAQPGFSAAAPQQVPAMASLFSHLDLDGDGELDVHELTNLMQEMGLANPGAGARALMQVRGEGEGGGGGVGWLPADLGRRSRGVMTD